MTTYFISRHQGAKEWIAQQGIAIDKMQSHLVVDDIQVGDTVIGTLPIQLVADVCQRGARYLHLTLTLTEELRGKDLSAEDMNAASATLEHFTAEKQP